jgi:hypothetical protein
MPVEDPWEQVTNWLKVEALGEGSRRAFSWYLEGTSTVQVGSVEDVCIGHRLRGWR